MAGSFRLEQAARPEHTALLLEELALREWQRSDADEWDLDWAFGLHDPNVYGRVRRDQRLNHFPGIVTQHSKDELAYFLRRAQQLGGDDFAFSPETYSMPYQFDAWRDAARDQSVVWIRKPKRGAKGHGVRVVTDVDAEVPDDTTIIQRYIQNPLIPDEYPHKHIIRVYLALTSLDPLIAYVHPRTFVRFASRAFSMSPEELDDPIRHITNPSVQLTNPELHGGIRIMTWREFCDLLERDGRNPSGLWSDIRTMLARTLAAHRRPMLTVTERYLEDPTPCFELLGYDVMIDDALKPNLVECNMSPLLSVRGAPGSPDRVTHESVKRPVISDLLDLVGIRAGATPGDRSALARFDDSHAHRGGFELLGPADGLTDALGAVDQVSGLDDQLWSTFGPD